MTKIPNSLKLLTSIIVCEIVGIAGTPFTITAIPNWYANLNKPFFSPPNWLFGPVWTVLYLCMGISFYLIWISNAKKNSIKIAVKWFLIQLGLNFLWTPVFFGLRSLVIALIIIVGMWGAIVMTIKKMYPISKIAAALLVPYLFWVSFATTLNASLLLLN